MGGWPTDDGESGDDVGRMYFELADGKGSKDIRYNKKDVCLRCEYGNGVNEKDNIV